MKFLADMGIAWRIVELLNDSSEALKKGAIISVEEARHRIRFLPIPSE